mmetsp:Transcript_41457/g.125266  ORF Transcript_41457/g.125266 Transcript_41457/m.125266 type:complete len:340 (-) Transcript_41457:521-1540(-)
MPSRRKLMTPGKWRTLTNTACTVEYNIGSWGKVSANCMCHFGGVLLSRGPSLAFLIRHLRQRLQWHAPRQHATAPALPQSPHAIRGRPSSTYPWPFPHSTKLVRAHSGKPPSEVGGWYAGSMNPSAKYVYSGNGCRWGSLTCGSIMSSSSSCTPATGDIRSVWRNLSMCSPLATSCDTSSASRFLTSPMSKERIASSRTSAAYGLTPATMLTSWKSAPLAGLWNDVVNKCRACLGNDDLIPTPISSGVRFRMRSAVESLRLNMGPLSALRSAERSTSLASNNPKLFSRLSARSRVRPYSASKWQGVRPSTLGMVALAPRFNSQMAALVLLMNKALIKGV